MTALEDRRQRAEDYGLLDVADAEEIVYAVRTAVRSATRVRITPEVIQAAMTYIGMLADDEPAFQRGLKAAFEAAGFEVEA